MYYENIEDFNPNIKLLNKVIVMGPQEEILKKLDYINSTWLTTQWLYRNRSRLEAIEPLTVTKTFRWSPGYKAKIMKVINERFDQYHKVTSKLDTLLISRPSSMEHTKKKFIQKLIEVDNDMRLLRMSGTTFADNTNKLEESLNTFKELLGKQIKSFEEFMINLTSQGENIDWNIGMQTVSDNFLEGTIRNNYVDRKLTKNEIEVAKWENTYIVFSIKWLKPKLTVINKKNEEIGKIDHEPIHLIFQIKVNQIINFFALDKEVSIDNFPHRISYRGRRQLPWSFTNNILRLDVMNNYSVMGKYDGEILKKDNSNSNNSWNHRIGLKMYPYIHCSTGTVGSEIFPYQLFKAMWEHDWHDIKVTNDSSEDRKTWNNICLGDLHTSIMNSFLHFDFIGMFLLLQKWQEFHLVSSNPLNQLRFLMMGIPSDKSPEFFKEVGLDTNNCARRLSITYEGYNTDIHRSRKNKRFIDWYNDSRKKYDRLIDDISLLENSITENGNEDDEAYLDSLTDEVIQTTNKLEDNITSMLSMDNHCNTIECQGRNICWSYSQRQELWEYMATGKEPEIDEDGFIHDVRCNQCRVFYYFNHRDYTEYYENIDRFRCYECVIRNNDSLSRDRLEGEITESYNAYITSDLTIEESNIEASNQNNNEMTQEDRENQMATWVEQNLEGGRR